MPEKKNRADTPKTATGVRKAESKEKSRAEVNAKAAARATQRDADKTSAEKAPAVKGKATAARPAAAKRGAAPAKRAVARPVTRVVRPEAERFARPAAPAPREKREKPAARPLPTAPAGHAPLIAADGSSSGSIELPKSLAKPGHRIATVFQAFIAERANARQATSATKNRHRVAGGGAKPWRQKGTGRARAGSTRSPLWRHGGVVFGPNGRQYGQRMPEKMRRAAFSEAMSARAAEGRVLIVESMKLEGDRPRTRDAVSWLDKIGDMGSTVFVWNEIDLGAARAMANLPDMELRTPGSLRLSDVLEADTLLVMRPALDALAARARPAAEEMAAGAVGGGSRS
jgi:large subunit ribosomal protein L4